MRSTSHLFYYRKFCPTQSEESLDKTDAFIIFQIWNDGIEIERYPLIIGSKEDDRNVSRDISILTAAV